LLFALALGLGAGIVALPAIGSAGAQVGSPTLTVSPATAAAGESVTVRGTNNLSACAVNAISRITLLYDGTRWADVTTLQPDGSFTISLPVPQSAIGTHQVRSACTVALIEQLLPLSVPQATTAVNVIAGSAGRPTVDPSVEQPPPGTFPPPTVLGTESDRPSSQEGVSDGSGSSTSSVAVGDGPAGRTAPGGGSSGGGSGQVASGLPAVASADTQGSADAVSEVPALSLATPGDIFASAAHVAVGAGVAAFLLLFIGWPAELFNNTLQANYEEMTGWAHWLRSNRLVELASRLPNALGFAGFAVVVGLMYSFLSPSFGANRESLAFAAGLTIGLVVVMLGFELPAALYLNRLHIGGRLRMFPQSIPIAMGCVAISRFLGFRPGYLYGLTCAYAPDREPTAAQKGRAAALGGATVLALSLLAWGVWIPVNDRIDADASFVALVVQSTLAAIVVAGIQGLVFTMLPVRFNDGADVKAWSTSTWRALFGASLLALVFLLLSPAAGVAGSWRLFSLLKACTLFILFGVGSFAVWAYFRFRPPRPVIPEPQVDVHASV
jgi:hypothetical protein